MHSEGFSSWATGVARSAMAISVLVVAGCGAGASRHNLLLISMDTTRGDRFGCTGWAGAHTPTIDALAAEGFKFSNHMTPVPITLPAHTTIMTGLYPPTHTVRDNGTFTVPDAELTLAEVLSANGWDTAAFVASFPLSARFGLNQGFAVYDDHLPGWSDRVGGRKAIQADGLFFDERPASMVVDAALDWFGDRPSHQPFFAFLHFFDPHQPMMAPPPYDVSFRERPYDGEIAYVDEQLGRLFQALRERGLWDDTIVILTADHGEGQGEHGELTHALLLHQATLHVPLILRGPGVPHGSSSDWSLSTQLFDTCLELLGVPRPPSDGHPRGVSLVARMAGNAPVEPFTAYFETVAPRTSQGWAQQAAWMEGDWRYIHSARSTLYQLAEDPSESHGLLAEEPMRAHELEQHLRDFLAANEVATVSEAMSGIDDETARRLAALGYLTGDPAQLDTFDDMLDVADYPEPRDLVITVSMFSQAKASLALGELARARSLLAELLQRAPKHAEAHQMLATVYAALNMWPEAFSSMDRAIALDPGNSRFRRLRGMLLIEVERVDEGVDLLVALPESEQDANLCGWIGRGKASLGDTEGAEEWYRRGLGKTPDDRWLRLYLANLLASEGRHDEADGVYRGLIDDVPYFHLAVFNYALSLSQSGRTEEALAIARRAMRLAPDHAPSVELVRRLELTTGGSGQ